MPGGRPSKYKAIYCKEIIKFFSGPRSKQVLNEVITRKDGTTIEKFATVGVELPFLSGFARKIDVETETLERWAKKFPEFCRAYKKAKELQHEFLATNALLNYYNAGFACFTAKNITDWRDKHEIETTGKGISILNVVKTYGKDAREAKEKEGQAVAERESTAAGTGGRSDIIPQADNGL